MPYDPDLQPLLDAKADKTALAGKTNTATTTALTNRVKVLEAKVAALEGQPIPSPPPPPTPPPPTTGILLTIGGDWDAIIGGAPAASTFLFQSGVHLKRTVKPRSGDIYASQPGAILDGDNVAMWAVEPGYANDIKVRGLVDSKLEVRKYKPQPQYAPITARTWEGGSGGIGWQVEDVYSHHNSDVGIHLSDGSVMRRCRVSENGIIGIKVYWARTKGALVEDVETWGNNTTGADEYWEAGGSKFAWNKNLIVRRTKAHHNNGPGLWTDIDNIGTIYEDCEADDNSGAGIFDEISYGATIRRCKARGNGFRNRGWLWEAGIMVAGSQNVLIEDCPEVFDNFNGITLIQQARGSGALGPYLLKNVTVQRCKVRGGRTGVVQDVGDPTIFTARNLKYLDNDYTSTIHVWAGADRTWAQWQGYGHDLTGSNV